MVIENGQRAAVYPVSTSKFGLGDRWGSMATPLGWLQVAEKIGDHAPFAAVFHKRRFTGEILPPNAPGRDPIVTRIIWLRGLERSNANAFSRCIYIHGTAEEKSIGKPSSYGCVRMCSKDVTEVYAQLQVGALVRIIPDSLPNLPNLKATRARLFSPRMLRKKGGRRGISAAAGKRGLGQPPSRQRRTSVAAPDECVLPRGVERSTERRSREISRNFRETLDFIAERFQVQSQVVLPLCAQDAGNNCPQTL